MLSCSAFPGKGDHPSLAAIRSNAPFLPGLKTRGILARFR